MKTKNKTKKQEKIFDKYKDDIEHNAIIGLMVKLIGSGLASNWGVNLSLDDVLYINHLLDGLRR